MDIRDAYYAVNGRSPPETDTDTAERLFREDAVQREQDAKAAGAAVQAAIANGYGLAVRDLQSAAFGMSLFLRGRANLAAVMADLALAKQAISQIEAALHD